MRVLVTGGAGFIGGHICELLAEEGHEAVGFDRLTHPAQDVRDPGAVRAALPGIDAVCHQAAKVGLGVDFSDAPGYVSDNDTGTAVLLAGLHEAGFTGPVVLASSMVVYGEGAYACPEHGPVAPGPREPADLDAGRFEPPCPRCGAQLEPRLVDEDAPADPRNVYAATKLHQEHLAGAFAREHPRVTVTALRYHNVYGPRMPRDTPYAGVASIFRSALAAGRAPRVFEDGGQRRDFVHVRDVARANVLALSAGEPGAFNVASGEPHTVLDMASELAAAAGGPVPEVTSEYRLGDVRHVVASPARARERLGFRAEVAFADGMRAFAADPLREP